MNKIHINGVEYIDNSAELKKVAVSISGSWYSRSSPEIVKIGGKYFRKNSPLIVLTVDNTYVMGEDTVEVFSKGSYSRYLKGDSRIVHTKLDSDDQARYYLGYDLVYISGKFYDSLDKRLITTHTGLICLKEDCVMLHPDYGSNNYIQSKYLKDGYCVEFDGHIYFRKDILNIIYQNEDGSIAYSRKAVPDHLSRGLFQLVGFSIDKRPQKIILSHSANFKNNAVTIEVHHDKFTPLYAKSDSRLNAFIKSLSSMKNVCKSVSEVDLEVDGYTYSIWIQQKIVGAEIFSPYSSNTLIIFGHDFSAENLINEMRDMLMSSSKKFTNAISKRVYSIKDIFNPEKENIPKIISQNVSTEGASYTQSRVELSNYICDKEKNDKAGGINYSFGVEIETSYGTLPTSKCIDLNLGKVGDRTIGAMEYITPPLHGNSGIEYLRDVAKHLAHNTMVDDRCGLHVHVGGIKGSSAVSSPNFGYDFAYRAILLGSFIEDELYSMLPSIRSFTNQCSSMKEYGKDITDENKLDVIGTYIYGAPISKVDTSIPISKWTDLRKKWLNLMYCTANYRQQTLEFRIFQSTTDADSIVCNVLLTMAFVKLVDTDTKLEHIKNGITLNKMVDLTLNSDCAKMVKKYIMYNKKLKKSKAKKSEAKEKLNDNPASPSQAFLGTPSPYERVIGEVLRTTRSRRNNIFTPQPPQQSRDLSSLLDQALIDEAMNWEEPSPQPIDPAQGDAPDRGQQNTF